MKNAHKTLFSLLAFVVLTVQAYGAPKVLVSIKPIHALVASVMAGVATPDLLIGGGASVHSYAFKPSDARKIENADIVFYVGPDLETYLTAPLKNLSHGKSVALESGPGIIRRAARHGGLWEGDEDHGHDHGPADPHLWLDPNNAIAMTNTIAKTLSAADPANAHAYRTNAAKTVTALSAMDVELRAQLAPLKGKPYLVFHDAYQYFEARYGLSPVGAIAVAPDRPVGPRRVSDLRESIAKHRVICLFREPQFPPKLVETIRSGSAIKVGILDPLGADIPAGPGLYSTVLRRLAQSLAQCLQ